MLHKPRIGIQIGQDDPFWVQVREVIWQQAQLRAVEVIEIDVQESHLLTPDEQAEVVEDLIVQELDALICNIYPPSLLARILDRSIPIVYVSEIELRHPRFTSRVGLYDAAHMLGRFLHKQLAGSGTVLVVGGFAIGEDTGQSRLDGFAAALPRDYSYTLHHVPCDWSYEAASAAVGAFLAAHSGLTINAVFGLSDSLALAARDTCSALGRSDEPLHVLGLNGDPLALAAIANGSMSATVETDIDDIAAQAVYLAHRAATGALLPPHFRNKQRLVTVDNVSDVAMRKLLSLATLPTRLINVTRRSEQQRVVQRETGTAIDRQVGTILNERQLSLVITALIRDSYGFDEARFLRWRTDAAQLLEADGSNSDTLVPVSINPTGPLAYALAHNQPVFIPDTFASHRFAPDALWPDTRARVVLPVRLGEQIVGLLDLHRRQAAHHTREELVNLQLLADRLGTAVRNAELYGEALMARALAEKADRLKTVLLTNVSHELRTPLHVIMASSRSALARLEGGQRAVRELAQDLRQMYGSGEHLLRLINDLLDLSRAEIGELDLRTEAVDLRPFLEDVFRSSVSNFGASGSVVWRLELPPELPTIMADPVRLRQVLLNLLHNAHKFTDRGEIALGAAAAPAELHLWVADTGTGIPPDLQEQIFDPFISVEGGKRQHEGIGLGLSIARRLVELHHGRMALDSSSGRGSTFHIYLPLAATTRASSDAAGLATLLLLSADVRPPASLASLAERRGLTLRQLRPGDTTADLAAAQPALVAWDIGAVAASDWDVVAQLRAHPQLAQLPIMLYHGGEDGQLDTGSVATGLLLKPLDNNALVAALQDLAPDTLAGEILIVEDDAQTRAMHHRLISEHFPRYAVREATNGRAALAYLADKTPGLIVLDLVMPEIDGFAVLEVLRADPRTAVVPVLVLSGKPLSADDVHRIAEARVSYQTKDMLAEGELAESLRRALGRADPLPAHTSALVKHALGFIQQRYDDPISLQEIADALGVNRHYLGRIFQQELGLSPWQYLIRYRVLRAKELLRTTNDTIAQIAARVGFDSATYFSHIFHREVGASPRAFRAQPPTK